MDMDEVEAVVEATKEVGMAMVRAEACDLRKNESDLHDPGAYYVFSVYETDYLFNTPPIAKFEDVLNFSVNDTNVGLVVDSGAFYDMMSETDYNKLKGKIRLEKCWKKLFSYASKNPLPVLGQCKARITVPETGAPVNACRPSPGDKWPYLLDKYLSIFNGPMAGSVHWWLSKSQTEMCEYASICVSRTRRL